MCSTRRSKGRVNPLALKTLEAYEYPAEGFRSKSWDEFTAPDAPELDFVFTVCDSAAGEACPAWPGQMTAHWGIEDPAAVEGTDIEKERAFNQARLRPPLESRGSATGFNLASSARGHWLIWTSASGSGASEIGINPRQG